MRLMGTVMPYPVITDQSISTAQNSSRVDGSSQWDKKYLCRTADIRGIENEAAAPAEGGMDVIGVAAARGVWPAKDLRFAAGQIDEQQFVLVGRLVVADDFRLFGIH